MADGLDSTQPEWTRGASMLPIIKTRLRIDGSDKDETIVEGWEEAIDELDYPSGRLNRSLRSAFRTAPLSFFHQLQPLPGRPVLDIVDVEERQGDGSWASVPDHGVVLEDDHRAWVPSAPLGWRERRIRYRAGYLELPMRVQRILMLMVEETIDGIDKDRSQAIERAIAKFRLAAVG